MDCGDDSSFMDFGWSCFISLFFPPDPEDKISIGRDFFVGDDGKAFWGFTGTKKKRGIVAVRFGDCLFLELWRFSSNVIDSDRRGSVG